jgi:hypothetical protein
VIKLAPTAGVDNFEAQQKSKGLGRRDGSVALIAIDLKTALILLMFFRLKWLNGVNQLGLAYLKQRPF